MIDDRGTNVESASEWLASQLRTAGMVNQCKSVACAVEMMIRAVLYEERRDAEGPAAVAADHIAAAISILRNPCYDAASNIEPAIRRLEAAARILLPPSERVGNFR